MFVTVLTGGIVTALDSFLSSDATVMICFGFVISYIVLKCFCERSNESRRLYRVTLLRMVKELVPRPCMIREIC